MCPTRVITTRSTKQLGADERSVIHHFPMRRRVTPEPAFGPRFARTRWANAPYALRVSEERTFDYHKIFRG